MTDVVFWNATEPEHPSDFLALRKRTSGVYVMKKWLEICDYQSEVVDFANRIETDELIKLTLKYADRKTLCIGVNMTFMSHGTNSEWLTRAWVQLKELLPDIKLCMGGHNPFLPVVYPNFNKSPDITYLQGHGEEIMIEYLDHLSGRSATRPNFDIQTKASTYPDNFRAFPGEALDIEISRGCQFKCKFCRYPLLGKKKGTYIRHRDYIIQELQENYERWGTTRYRITCDTFNEDNDKVEMLRDIQRELPFDLEWTGFLRMDLLQRNPHQLEQLYESGLRSVFFGVESINYTSSKAIAKGWHGTLQGMEYFKNINADFNKNKVRLTAGMIAGLPGDTHGSLHRDVDWLLENEVQSGTYTALSVLNIKNGDYPYPSAFDRESERYGYEFKDRAGSLFNASEWTRVSDGMSYTEFKIIADELNNRLYHEGLKHRGLTSWKLFDYASVMNISVDDAISEGDISRHWVRDGDFKKWQNVRVQSFKDIGEYLEQKLTD